MSKKTGAHRPGDPSKRNRPMVTIEYQELNEGDRRGVVTRDGFIGLLPREENAHILARLTCGVCPDPVVYQWHDLDEIDEDTPAAMPLTFSCAKPQCFPYRGQLPKSS